MASSKIRRRHSAILRENEFQEGGIVGMRRMVSRCAFAMMLTQWNITAKREIRQQYAWVDESAGGLVRRDIMMYDDIVSRDVFRVRAKIKISSPADRAVSVDRHERTYSADAGWIGNLTTLRSAFEQDRRESYKSFLTDWSASGRTLETK